MRPPIDERDLEEYGIKALAVFAVIAAIFALRFAFPVKPVKTLKKRVQVGAWREGRGPWRPLTVDARPADDCVRRERPSSCL